MCFTPDYSWQAIYLSTYLKTLWKRDFKACEFEVGGSLDYFFYYYFFTPSAWTDFFSTSIIFD